MVLLKQSLQYRTTSMVSQNNQDITKQVEHILTSKFRLLL